MSVSVHSPRRRVRLARILRPASLLSFLCLGLLVSCDSGGVGLTEPESSERYTSSAQGFYTLSCDGSVAIQFDGRDDHIDLSPDPIITPKSVTVEAWVKIEQLDKIHILVTDASDDFNDGFTLLVNGTNRAQFTVAASSVVRGSAIGSTTLEPGRWYHVAGVYDASAEAVRVYVDGVEDGSVAYADGVSYAAGRDLRFGMQVKVYSRASRYLKGAIDEVRIWNRARSAAEIAAEMEVQFESGQPSLAGYWPMDEGEGRTTADLSGGDNAGVLEDGATWVDTRSECQAELAIDVKPGGDPDEAKPVNLNDGKLPVAILSTADFDVAAMLDLRSLTFGRTGDEASMHWLGSAQPNCAVSDVNEDGAVDLVCHFLTAETGLQDGDREVYLKGRTVTGVAVGARDEIRAKSKGKN